MSELDINENVVAVSIKGISKYFTPSAGQKTVKQMMTSLFKRDKYNEQKSGYWALHDINFDIQKGEFFGIIGRNGSGKSTLLKMIAGVYTPTSGAIRVDGRLVPFIELGVGFNPELSGRDNVFLNGALLGFSRKQMQEMYDEIVDFAELRDHMDIKLKNFSSGMQVRLAFSIAIRAGADVLLIDEVLAVGDIAFQEKCLDYFYELKRSGRTVVFVSHDMESVKKFCDRAAYIYEGRVKMIGDVQDVSDSYMADMHEGLTLDDDDSSNKDDQKPKKTQTLFLSDTVTKFRVEKPTKSVFRVGNEVSIKMSYTLSVDFNVELRTALVKEGIAVAHISTFGQPMPSKKGDHTVELKLSTDNLLEGKHELYCGVFDRSKEKQLAFKTRAAKFYIQDSSKDQGGFFALEGKWKEVP